MKVDGKVRYYTSVRECARVLYRTEGWRGFYAGLSANASVTILSNIIMLMTREQIKMRVRALKSRR